MDSSLSAGVRVDITNHMNAVVLPIFSILAILITYLPFRSFYQNRNFPAANLVVVVSIQNLMVFTNALIWPNGDWTTWWNGVALCDIQSYIRLPLTTTIASSLTAFTRTLVSALDVDKHNFIDTPALRRRILIIDILICWTIPVIQIGLYYVIQLSRYVILPVYGCGNLMDPSWVTVLIMFPWAPLFSLISAYHACQIMCRLHKHKANLSNALSSNNSGYTARRYLKLFLIAIFLIIIVLPIQFYCLYVNVPVGPEVIPYSWSRVHEPVSWNAIVYLNTSDVPNLQYYGWFTIALSLEIFMFFGFNDDAVDAYRKGLAMLGFGKIWPSLKEPREVRRLRTRSETKMSWSSHFDLVSKALHYFDAPRKNSQATTVVGSDCGQSRKGSHAATSTIALGTIKSNLSSPNNKATSSADGSSIYRSFFDADAITPAPSPFGPNSTLLPIQEPQPTVTPAKNRGILTTWRTHIHLPFPLFSSKATTPVTEKRASVVKDIEAQNLPRKSSLSHITHPATTISTSIWSEPSPAKTRTQTHTSYPSSSTHLSVDEIEMVDPLSPKLGSRAYRERERREMEREKREAGEAMRAKKNVENSNTNLGERSSVGGGVVVKTTRMEVSEEGPSSP